MPYPQGMAYLFYKPKPYLMEFFENQLYHLYNRGNNQQPIFFNHNNYLYFLEKVRKFILPYCETLNYSLMPNHFHFFIYADYRSIQTRKIGDRDRNIVSEGVRNLLQTYSKAINKQNKTTGSLFQQNTRAKQISEGSRIYGPTCFHYIHQNAWKARLVKKMEDWEYCSFKDYAGLRNGTLCNKKLAFGLLDLDPKTFYNDSYNIIDDSVQDFIL
jgi:putative transposase